MSVRSIYAIVIKVFYLPTDAQENCFKKNIKIYIEFLHVSVQSPSSGNAYSSLLKLQLLK